MEIIRTAAEEDDLIQIWLDIAEFNPSAADNILDRIETRWQILSRFPKAGVAPEDIGNNVRHLVEGDYIIFYRPTKQIEILRVLHTRRKQGPEIL